MTGAAVRSELTVVMIVLFMAGITILRCALENAIHMATRASHINVRASQLEGRQIMIKGGRFPSTGVVTSAATCAKLSIVCIILFMARIAILRCTFENFIDMTLRTCNVDVRAC